MKVQELFKFYKQTISERPDTETIFSNSGILNEYALLDFGFFPIGSGILTNDNTKIEEAEINNCDVMVLGNDFGTMQYVLEQCPNKREKLTNPTIRNLVKTLELNLETTFFTNLFLGLRKEGTNIKRITKLNQDYKETCFSFFKKQLDYLDPKVVLCLGKDVGQALSMFSNEFTNFSSKKSISKMFVDSSERNYIIYTHSAFFGQRKFILIPHPSFAHINWSDDTKLKIKAALQSL